MSPRDPLRVLVVDDSIVYRKAVGDLVADLPGCELAGTAINGRVAQRKVAALRPDALVLDLEMPELDGLGLLAWLRAEAPGIGVVMLSSTAAREQTLRALELGAFDFVAKPSLGSPQENRARLADQLTPCLRALARGPRPSGPAPPPASTGTAPAPVPAAAPAPPTIPTPRRAGHSPAVVGIGVSTGGPGALAELLPGLPADLPVPVLVVQHMPPLFTATLAQSLDARCALHVKEAADGETPRPGTVYLAPGGRHLKVVPGPQLRVTDDPPERNCRPAADYLFRSLAAVHGPRAVGVIMTGMGSDGTAGLEAMKAAGAVVLAQDAASCVVFGMPREPIARGIVDHVVPLPQLAQAILRAVCGGPVGAGGERGRP
jgi:two-component system chemotaxis response regulator CheB